MSGEQERQLRSKGPVMEDEGLVLGTKNRKHKGCTRMAARLNPADLSMLEWAEKILRESWLVHETSMSAPVATSTSYSEHAGQVQEITSGPETEKPHVPVVHMPSPHKPVQTYPVDAV